MIKKIISIVLIIFFFGFESTYAQDPNHFVLGEAEFKNAEIYSILQTQNKQLYIGTNEGLYQYVNGKMREIPNAPTQKGTSIFNLIANSKNEVFCSNLNGQIFKLENNKLRLFFEVPKEYLGPQIDIEFDDSDRLILISKACIKINGDGDSYEVIYSSENKLGLKLSRLPNKSVIASIHGLDSIFIFEQNKTKKELFEGNKGKEPYQIVQFNNTFYSSKDIDKNIPSYKFSRLNYTYHQFQRNKVWRRNKSQGIDLIESIDDKLKLQSYFKDTFISYVAKGEADILFLGTFGQGLYVIPNLNTLNYNNTIKSKSLQSISGTENGSIFLSDRHDGILHFKDSITNLASQIEYIPNRLFTLKKAQANIVAKYPSLFFGRQGDYGAIKNVFEVDSTTFLIASSLGVSKKGERNILAPNLWKRYNPSTREDTYALKNINQRTNDVCYDIEKEVLYVATIATLYKIDKNGNKKELLFNDKPLIINDLYFYQNEIWCATQNNGILIYDGTEFNHQISVKNGLGSNYVYKFMEKDGQFFISHKEGFQVYEVSSKKWKAVGLLEGIEKGAIKEFCINNDTLWFLSNNQVISLPLNEIKSNEPFFTFKIDSIKAGDEVLNLKEKTILKYNQNDLHFFTDFNGILYESEAFYEYQLLDFDKKSRTAPVIQQSIDYSYLPAGEYRFSIKVNYRNYSSTTFLYEFKIQQAFWKTYWFFALISICFTSGIILYIYQRNQKLKHQNLQLLEKQTLKTDLVESELKSLRSQINPHFIFNSLNSIQDLILEKQTKASYDYIVLFSDLVRNALNYSNSSFISIDKEIEFLKTYLKLEELRFGSEFSYEVNYNCPKEIKIPALLIQPFVENAIVHGLFHKDGNKKVTVNFNLKKQHLECTIVDNGIGRKEAAHIKDRQGNLNESYALDAITKRLEILSEKYNVISNFEIEDIIIQNVFSGTKVTVNLPFLD